MKNIALCPINIFNACQWSCAKVMFSFISTCLVGEEGIPTQGHPPTLAPTPALAPPRTCWNLFNFDLTVQGPSAQTYSTCTSLDSTPPPSKHVQTCSLCSPDCWQAGGWHLTEMPSCLFWFSLSTTNTNPDLPYGTIIWCIKEIVTEH